MKKIVLALGFLLACYLAPVSQASAAGQLICYEVSSLVCQPVGTGTPLPVNASVSASISGFQPSASGARGTPITVSTSDSSGTLPTGAVVLVSNPGANLMYCNVNGVAATISDEPITSGGGWFAFTIPATITTLHCIATGGSTTANMVGGSGLPTGTGGGGGSGGGGAITAASSSYASGAFSAGSGTDGWDVTEGTKADAAYSGSGSGSIVAILKWIGATLNFILTAVQSPVPLGTTGGITPLQLNALTNGAIAIKASAGQLFLLQCGNTNASEAYVQVYNVASGSVSVGTTAPTISIPIAATSTGGFALSLQGLQFGTAISAAATTTATGGTGPSTALDCNVGYN